ncbi:MAG TPA: 6-phosphogluconolactonase [Candidatus Sulfotelmatobacter sp.]|nr:6-phosphogluconolactonase [Candidatus Sulfotelmatobacter sp.]
MSATPAIEVVADPAALADAAATRVAAALREAIAARGVAHVALTGGSTAPPLYERLVAAGSAAGVAWDAVHCWWGDERFVPLDHPASNAGVAQDVLGIGLGLPAANLHPWPVAAALADGSGPDGAARAYAADVRAALPVRSDGDPVFDLLLLGVGPDGHVLSCFPGSPGLAADAPLALGIPAPSHVEPHLARVTFRARVVAAARRVLVMVGGGGKADVLHDILEGPLDPLALPAQVARVGQAVWLLDRAAAARLTPPREP